MSEPSDDQEPLLADPSHGTVWAHRSDLDPLESFVDEANELREPRLVAPADFEVLQEVGRGGMAVVYKARQRSLGRIVALKMLASVRTSDTGLVSRFRWEAQAVAQMQHPNAVQIFEVGQVEGRPYLVLEFIAGGTLQRRLDGRPLTAESAAHLIEILARAVHYAHRRGIVHRDLKPANILLEPLEESPADSSDISVAAGVWSDVGRTGPEAFRPKISDFGLAKASFADSELTLTGQILGTPSYMSPEQALGHNDAITPSSDLYALGAILYQLLTGRPPFHGGSMLEVLDQVRSEDPTSPRRLQPKVPRDLETICLHCLEKNPERRYASAEELADDLRRFLQHLPIAARPASWLERSWKSVSRRPLVSALTLAVTLSVVLGVAGITWQWLAARDYAIRAAIERDQAQWQHRQAVTERFRANALRVEAEQQSAKAAALQAEAERNFQRAFRAIDEIRQLGSRYYGQPEQATVGRELLQFTLAYYEGFLSENSTDSQVRAAAAGAFANAGDIVSSLGERERAVPFYRRAIDLGQKLTDEEPESPARRRFVADAWRKLGNNLRGLTLRDESEGAYAEAIQHYELVLHQDKSDDATRIVLANTKFNLAFALRTRNRRVEAVELYADAERLLREISRTSDLSLAEAELAICLDDHGRLLWETGDIARAEPRLREALALRERQSARDSKHAGTRKMLARSHLSLALIAQQRSDWEDARQHVRQALQLYEQTARENPSRLDMQTEYPPALNQWAMLQWHAGDHDDAEKVLRETTQVRERLARRFPHDGATVMGFAYQEYLLGELLWERGKADEARVHFAAALARYETDYAQRKESALLANALAWSYSNCPAIDLRRLDRALALAQCGVAADPRDADRLNTLGVAYYRKGQYAAAIDALSKAVAIRGDVSRTDQAFLALSLHANGQQEQAALRLSRFRAIQPPLHLAVFENLRFGAEVESRFTQGTPLPTP